MRAIMDEKASHGVELGMRPKGVLSFDIIATLDKLELLNKKGLKQHQFTLEGEMNYFGRSVYVISFDQNSGIKKALYKGKMYLEKESLAFVYFEYDFSPKGLDYAKYGDGPTRALLKLFGMNIDIQKDAYRIYYQKLNDRWYLHKVSNKSWLNLSSMREYYNFPVFARIEYVVTEIDTSRKTPFPNAEVINNSKIFEDHYSLYDPDFWENYNIILADFDFQEIAKTIQERNAQFDYKQQLEDRLHKFPKELTIRIDSILSFYHQENLFNGVALIKKGEEVIYQQAFGWANREGSQSNSIETPFRIGSTSKTFTAHLIMQLVEKGQISLSDSLALFYPDHIHGKVTIHELLTHQSGIPSFTKNTQYLNESMEKEYSMDSLIYKFTCDSLSFPPGSSFEYSNSGYLLLAGIIESVVGEPFSQVMKDYIFEPLKMNDSWVGASKEESNLITKGYLYGQPEPTYPLNNFLGTGGIITTVNDLVKWSEALDDFALLSSTSSELLFQPHADYKDWQSFYGYGWMIDQYQFKESKKHKVIYHPGTDLGFYSMFVKQPDEKITIVLLSNHGDFPRFDYYRFAFVGIKLGVAFYYIWCFIYMHQVFS